MKFQTRVMTAMDVWLCTCMVFVALAIFEYAILLAMRFGTHFKINTSEKKNDEFKTTRKCVKIDRLSLKIFFLAYLLAVSTYFYILQSKYRQDEEPDNHNEYGHAVAE